MQDISEKLTQDQLQAILMEIYKKGHQSGNLDVKDLINDIKRQIITLINS